MILVRLASGHPNLYETTAIPYRPGVAAAALTRSGAWVDPDLVRRPPAEVLPIHRCPAYEQQLALAGDVLDAWLDAMSAPAAVRRDSRRAAG